MTTHPDLGLPWRVHSTACDVDVDDRDGAMVADFAQPGPMDRAQARAEYAVRAANAHAAMVEALREIAALPSDPDKRDMTLSQAIDAMRDIARSALAEERAP